MTDVDKLLEGISTSVCSEFEDSPKLSATQFQILDSDLNATSFSSGVLMNMGGWGSFAFLIVSLRCVGLPIVARFIMTTSLPVSAMER